MTKKLVEEKALAALAKKYREAAGVTKAEAGREFQLSRPTITNAEEHPEMSLTKVRIRLIEKYSPFKVVGPVFFLKEK